MDPALFRVRANMALHLRAADRRPIVLEIRQILTFPKKNNLNVLVTQCDIFAVVICFAILQVPQACYRRFAIVSFSSRHPPDALLPCDVPSRLRQCCHGTIECLLSKGFKRRSDIVTHTCVSDLKHAAAGDSNANVRKWAAVALQQVQRRG